LPGAGKTSVLNHLLQADHGLRLAVRSLTAAPFCNSSAHANTSRWARHGTTGRDARD